MNNDYSHLLARLPSKTFAYSEPVSVVIPTYNRKDKLAKALAAMAHQSYPLSLVEFVVADDGSTDGVETVIRDYEDRLNLIHVRHPHRGHRLAQVCNLGLRTSRHESIILLQCDMLPHPGFIEAYMRLLHRIDEALLIGHRRFTCSDHLTPADILNNPNFIKKLPEIRANNQMWVNSKSAGREDWRLGLYRRTDWLKTEMWPFRAVVGSNLAFKRALLRAVGGFCEDFIAWGCEDGEFGYRVYNAGFYFIPVSDAWAFHQEPLSGDNETDRQAGFRLTSGLREQRCPVPLYRSYSPGRSFEVPKISLCLHLEGGNDVWERVRHFLEQLMYMDLEVIIIFTGVEAEIPDLKSKGIPIRWIPEPGVPIGQTLNIAVRASRGTYLCHSDLRPEFALGVIESLTDCLDNQNIGCVYCALHPTGVADTEEHRKEDEKTSAVFCMYRKRDWCRSGGFRTVSHVLDQRGIIDELSKFCVVAGYSLLNAEYTAVYRQDTGAAVNMVEN